MKKKKWIIVLVVVAVLAIGGAITGGQESNENNTPVEQDKDAEKTEMNFGWDSDQSESEEGTSARVDEIMLKAVSDAQKVTEEEIEPLWEEAFAYLKEHEENFYANNEIMEKSIYYGCFIYEYIEENSPATDISQLPETVRYAYDAGYNTVLAIKYVYRGAENIEDRETQNALNDAREALEKFE